jgi:hypothetical protein
VVLCGLSDFLFFPQKPEPASSLILNFQKEMELPGI